MKKLSEQYREKYTIKQFGTMYEKWIDDLLNIKYHETMKNYGEKSLDKWIEERHSSQLKELAQKHGLRYETNNP
jgi:hypothetical protein